MALERAGLSGATDSLTSEEIATLQRDYPSDDTASTVSIDQEESSVPTWTPAAAIAEDPIFGFADPIIVSNAVSEPNLDVPNPIDNLVRREKDRKAKLSTLKNPVTKVHCMDLFDIRFQLAQLCWYLKRSVPALRPLARLVPGPGERIDPSKPRWLSGNQVSHLCQLLDSLSWVVDERVHIQELAGLNEFDYLGIYREHFCHKMDISIFDSPPPSKLPPAPRRLRYISSYRRSLGSLKSVGYVVPRVGQGSVSKRHRPKRQIRTRGVPETEPASPSLLGDQSPEI